MGILPELFNVRKVGPRGIVGDAISRVGVGGRQVRSRLAKSHAPAFFPNEDFDAEEFVFGTKATDSPAHAEGQKFQGEGGNWFVIRDGHAIPTANPNAAPAPVPDQKKTELTPDSHATRQTVADIGAKLRDGETVSPSDKEQFGEAFKTLTPDEQAKVADAIKPPATSPPNATPRRAKSDPGDWTIPDWEAAPGARGSQKRWRNRHTGDVRYGAKSPVGRNEAERKRHAEVRAEKLKQPAHIASGQWEDAEWDAAAGKYVHNKSADAAKKAEHELALTPENLTGLAGNMPGTSVVLRFNEHGSSMHIKPIHPDVTDWSRSLVPNKDGSLTLYNNLFFLRPSAQGGGFGTDAFANQVAACAASGVSRISTCAGRGTSSGVQMNGYSTWPVLGYDADLDESQIRRLPPELKHARTVQDLYETQAGKDWWKKHGESTSMTFDVSPNSRSLRVLNAYLAKNGKSQVNYTPEQHEENKSKQAKRAESLKTYGARSGFEPTHTQWADRARAAGFDAADIRRRAEARVTSSPNATPQDQQAALNTAYNDELNQRGRYRFVTALQEAGDDKGIMGAGPFVERAKALGYSQRELFNRARTLGIRDSSVLQAQTPRAAWINGLNLALDDLKTDRKSRLIQAMRDPAHRDLRDKYQAHVHSEIGDGQAFLNGLSSFGLNHAPALAESDPRRAAEEMFRATADAAITARRERLKREQEQAGAKS